MARPYFLLALITLFLFYFEQLHAKVLVRTQNGTEMIFYSTDIIYVGKLPDY